MAKDSAAAAVESLLLYKAICSVEQNFHGLNFINVLHAAFAPVGLRQ
jgi:hypothetical protein